MAIRASSALGSRQPPVSLSSTPSAAHAHHHPIAIMGKDHQDIFSAVRAEDVPALQKLLARQKGKPSKIGLPGSSSSSSSSKKYNVNTQDDDGLTPLHHAALCGNVRILSLLLETGAAVNIPDRKGLNPLHYAAWQGYMDPVGLLLSGGADANAQSVESQDTPLHLAAQHGHYDVVALLVQHRVDATLMNSSFKSALDLACEFGRSRVVDLLLQSDLCDTLLQDEDRRNSEDLLNKEKSSCLHLAAKNGHIDVIRLLLDAGMDINRQTMNGTCLHEAALCGKIDVVRLLLDYGVDVNRPNSFDQTALDIVNKFTTSRAAKDMKQLLREASSATQARTIHDYDNAFDPASLSFSKGEIVTVLEQNPDGHWKGFCSRDGQLTKTGFFPSAYVQVLTAEELGGRGGNEDQRQQLSKTNTIPFVTRDNRNDQPAYLQHGIPSKPVKTEPSPYGTPQQQQQPPLPPQRQNSHVESNDSHQVNHSHHQPSPQYGTLHPQGSPAKESSGVGGGSSRNSTVSVDSGRSSAFKASLSARHGGGGSGISTSSNSSSGVSSVHNGAGGVASNVSSGVAPGGYHNPSQPQPLGHRLSYESSASSSRQSYHSSSSSLGSLDKVLEDSSSNINVLDLFQKGCSDQEVLVAWLTDLRMDEYVNNFIHSGYDMPTITRMTPEDLTAIGVTKPGHRKKLKAEISQINVGDGIPDYKPADLLEWLALLRLEGYHASLTQQGYQTVDDILELTWEDLEEIGVSRLGHQKKLMLAIKYLQNPSAKKLPGGLGVNSLERDKQQSSAHLIGSPLPHHLHLPHSTSNSTTNRHSACSNSSNYSHEHRDSRGGGYEDVAISAPPAEIVHLRQGHAPPELSHPDIVAIQVRNSGGSFRLSQVSADAAIIVSGERSLMPQQIGYQSHQTFHSPTRRCPSAENSGYQSEDQHHYGGGLLMMARDNEDRDSTPTTTTSDDSHYSFIGEQPCQNAPGPPPRTLSPCSVGSGGSGSGRGGASAPLKVAPIRPRPVAKIVARTKASIHGEECSYEMTSSNVPDYATLPRNLKVATADSGNRDFSFSGNSGCGGGNVSPVPPSSPSKSPSGKRHPPPPPKRTNSTLDGAVSKSASSLDLDSSSLQKWADNGQSHPPQWPPSKETRVGDGENLDDSTQEYFASCVQSMATKFHTQTSSSSSSIQEDAGSNSSASSIPTASTTTMTGNDSDEAYHSQPSPSNNETPHDFNNGSGNMRNPLLDSPGSICSLDCEDFPPPPPPLAIEEFALVDVCKGNSSSHAPHTQTVSVSKLAEKLDAKLSLTPRPDFSSVRDIHHTSSYSSSTSDVIVAGVASSQHLRLQHTAPSPKPKLSTTTTTNEGSYNGAPFPTPNSPSRNNYVSFHFKENNNANRPTAPVVPQPHRGFTPQPPMAETPLEQVETTTTTLQPQVLGKPILMRKPSSNASARSSSSETLDGDLSSSSSSKWESSSSQSTGSSPHSTLGRGDTLPFANENVGTIKQRNPAPMKVSVLPSSESVSSASPFDSPAACVFQGVGESSSDHPKSAMAATSKSSSLSSSSSSSTSAAASQAFNATAPSVVGTMARRGGAKSVAQIPLDASLSSTIRRHSGLYPSSDEETAGLIPSSYRQFIPAATSTTSVVTTASGSSDSDTSSSISSTGTVQRRPHLPTSALAKEDNASSENNSSNGDGVVVVSKSVGVSEQFKQQPPPPPPAKPEKQQQQRQVSAPTKEEAAAAEPAGAEAEEGAAQNNPTSDLNDIVDSTNVLNDIGNMLAGLTEELDAMLDLNLDDEDDMRETVITE